MNLTVYKKFEFAASHVLPKHEGKCSRLHGHNWTLTVGVSGPVSKESGFVVDYAKLGEVVKAHIIDLVDHQHLGQGYVKAPTGPESQPAALGQDFYPSSENLVMAFVRMLKPLIVELGGGDRVEQTYKDPTVTTVTPCPLQLTYLSLDETCTCKAEWKEEYAR